MSSQDSKKSNLPKILAVVALVCVSIALYLNFKSEPTPEPVVPIVVEEVDPVIETPPAPVVQKYDPYAPEAGQYLVIHTFYEQGYYKYELDRMVARGEKPFTYSSRGRDFLMLPVDDINSAEAKELQQKYEGSWFTNYKK